MYGERVSVRKSCETKTLVFLKSFDTIFSLPSLHDPGGWAERLHHVRAWSLGMDVAGGAQRLVLLGRKETSEHRENKQWEEKTQQQSWLCINLHQFCFFLSSLLVLLLVVITILTGYADLFRHLSLFVIWESTSRKKNFIHIHSPAEPSKIWHFTGSPRPHTLNFDGWFLQLYSIIMRARLSINTWC